MQTKQCYLCKKVKTVDEFGRNRSAKDGLSYDCRTCHREIRQRYYEENREAVLEKNRKYREENREAVLECQRRHYEENREAALEYKRKYREENREAELERGRKYREENREAVLERSRKQRKNYQEMTRAMAIKTGRYSLEEDLVVLDETLTCYQKAVKIGRTYSSIKSRLDKLRKKARQNA